MSEGTFFFSMQHRALYIKIYVPVIVVGDINLPFKHCCVTDSIFIYFIVKCSSSIHTQFTVVFSM